MVTDFIIGVVCGIIGFIWLSHKVNTDSSIDKSMDKISKMPISPLGYDGMVKDSFITDFSNDIFTKKQRYILGDTDIHNLLFINKNANILIADMNSILTKLDKSESELEIRYKLSVLSEDIDKAISDYYCNREDIEELKQLKSIVDTKFKAINISLDDYKKAYISEYTNVTKLLNKLKEYKDTYVMDMKNLGNAILDAADYRDAKKYKDALVITDNEELLKYYSEDFEPRYTELVVKCCA